MIGIAAKDKDWNNIRWSWVWVTTNAQWQSNSNGNGLSIGASPNGKAWKAQLQWDLLATWDIASNQPHSIIALHKPARLRFWICQTQPIWLQMLRQSTSPFWSKSLVWIWLPWFWSPPSWLGWTWSPQLGPEKVSPLFWQIYIFFFNSSNLNLWFCFLLWFWLWLGEGLFCLFCDRGFVLVLEIWICDLDFWFGSDFDWKRVSPLSLLWQRRGFCPNQCDVQSRHF